MSLRIISGEKRGAKIQTPEGIDTRPLRDRIRESLFNMIRMDLRQANVLDCFAGSGAVGFEALSNGARTCTFIDPSKAAQNAVLKNAEKLQYLDRCTMINEKTPDAFALFTNRPVFDFVFLMPPYHSGLWSTGLSALGEYKLVSKHSQAIVEVHQEESVKEPVGWVPIRDKRYGITRLIFWQFDE